MVGDPHEKAASLRQFGPARVAGCVREEKPRGRLSANNGSERRGARFKRFARLRSFPGLGSRQRTSSGHQQASRRRSDLGGWNGKHGAKARIIVLEPQLALVQMRDRRGKRQTEARSRLRARLFEPDEALAGTRPIIRRDPPAVVGDGNFDAALYPTRADVDAR